MRDVPFRFGRGAAESAVLASLVSNGIAVIDNYLDEDEAARLRDEVLRLYDDANRRDLVFDKSRVKRLDGDELAQTLATRRAIDAAGTTPLVRAACDDFFGYARWRLGALYSMHYRDAMPTNDEFHIDPSPNLKFFYYLSDVTRATGPFTYCLASHREGYFRMRCGALEGVFDAYAIPEDEVRDARPIEGPSGTLVIFNAIGIHRAGGMQRGTERLTVTYHFEPKIDRSLVARLRRKLKPAESQLEYLCAYADKHKSRAFRYGAE